MGLQVGCEGNTRGSRAHTAGRLFNPRDTVKGDASDGSQLPMHNCRRRLVRQDSVTAPHLHGAVQQRLHKLLKLGAADGGGRWRRHCMHERQPGGLACGSLGQASMLRNPTPENGGRRLNPPC